MVYSLHARVILLGAIWISCVHALLIPDGVTQYPAQPVWSEYLADPFAFEVNGTYYMIGTGGGRDGDNFTFPGLISRDFITWEYDRAVLQIAKQAGQPDSYWAPEIAQKDNVFYLYYSAGFDDKQHRLRVASSTSPLGPYVDSEAVELTDVTKLSFAIDPHAFRDPKDGQWYLYYSKDFLDTDRGYRAGTGIVVDRLLDMTRLAGAPEVVLRARHDWQLFEANRSIYGQVYDWYTLEGASVWQKEPDVYVCFYSGSNWQTPTYGVDYGVASSPMGPFTEDSTDRPRVTRSVDSVIIGPGHNSVVRGPDQQTSYIVYHGWNKARTIRSPYISELRWKTQGPSNSSSGQDLLHVTLVFLVYVIVIVLIFHHAF